MISSVRAITLALTVLSLSAAPAAAGTVGGTSEGFGFIDDRGERNALTVRAGGGMVQFQDAAAPIETSDSRCQLLDAHNAQCASGGGYVVSAGAGDDSVEIQGDRVQGPPAFLSGGDGNDQIVAGPQQTQVDGGPGDDVIVGSGGTDYLDGGAGADSIFAGGGRDLLNGGLGPDRLNGGDGEDTVWYVSLGRVGTVQAEEPRLGPVSVDPLVPGWDGEPSEGDDVASDIEGYVTGQGDDVVRIVSAVRRSTTETGLGNDRIAGGPEEDFIGPGGGSDFTDAGPGDDWVYDDTGTPGSRYPAGLMNPPPGFAGDDVQLGGDGDDRLGGGGGRDLMSGGQGDDFIDAVDTFSETAENVIALANGDDVQCGPGRDQATVDKLDAVAPDCEKVTGWLGEFFPVVYRHGVVLPVECQPGAVSRCEGSVSVIARATALRHGISRFKARRGSRTRVRVELPERLLRRVDRGSRLRLRAVVRVKARGRTRAATRLITVGGR